MDYDSKRQSIQMLATLVATATYAAGFNPPGGVWQDIHNAAGHLPGDPIMRSTHHLRYAVFFYCNAVAFTLSLIIVVVTLFVNAYPDRNKLRRIIIWYQGFLMAAAMVAFTVAYGAGACRDKLTIVWYSVHAPFPFVFVIFQVWHQRRHRSVMEEEVSLRKLRMSPLSMFALTISYVAGLSTPGGFWDSTEGGHRPGDAILGDRLHGRALKEFLLLNTVTFVASLCAVPVTVLSVRIRKLVDILLVWLYLLCGLLGAYMVGNSRGRVNWPLYGEVFACMVAYVVVHVLVMKTAASRLAAAAQVCSRLAGEVSTTLMQMCRCAARPEDGESAGAIDEDQDPQTSQPPAISETENNEEETSVGRRRFRIAVAIATTEQKRRRDRRRAYLVQLMAGLAVAVTYQAGLYPPGGLWAANEDGHTAGDPILLATNARRYKGFYYCNSVSFVASLLVAMLLAQKEYQFLHNHHALEAAMLLDMLGLIGAYAIGSCRDQVSTLYVAGLAGAGVVYVFVHVSYFTLGVGDRGTEAGVENLRNRFLLLAILVASMTYQAGLTPPGGFLLKDDAQSGHRAGDPVLLYNYPRRYRAFFYCNSVSFTMSIVLVVLLVNPNHYRTAIQSQALTVCSALSYVCLMGAFAAGSTQHLTGSYFVFVLAGLPSFSSLILLLLYLWNRPKQVEAEDEEDRTSKRLTLAILVASATYPAGLDPPGGSWQSSSDGHDAGNPVMHDSRRQRYLAFFIGNTASFLASLMLLLVALLFAMWRRRRRHGTGIYYRRWVKSGLVSLQCLGFLVAYAAGSSRHWKTSAHIVTLVSAVLLFVAIHVTLSVWQRPKPAEENQLGQGSQDGGLTARSISITSF